MEFKINLKKLNILNEKISIIDKGIKVDTPNGWKDIKEIGITSPNSEKIILKTKDFELVGSPNHRVKYNENWLFLKDLKVGDLVNTKNGVQSILSVFTDNTKEDLWDIEVDEHEYYSNGILSHNSSFLSSFEYTLYGKVRGGRQKKWTTLSTLPNRINGELLNRISFKSGGVDVEIKRGISPSKLELWENGILNERAGKANIDDSIESYVGMDIETFKSFISMSINDFKNFISLSNEEKQLLLDKLFNLEVVNILNSILKELNKNNKLRMASLDAEIRTLDESISSINKSIEKSIQKSIEKGKQDLQSEINRLMTEMNDKKDDYKALKEKVDKIKEKEEILSKEIENEKKQYIIVQGDIKNVQREIDLYDSGKCPTCGTDFDSDHFVALREALVEKKSGFDKIKTEIEVNIKAVKERQIKLKEIAEGTQTSYNEMSFFLKNCKTQIEQLNRKKQNEEVVETTVDVEEFRRTIIELEDKKSRGHGGIGTTKDKELYYKELNKIFGEDGVKKSIIAGIIKPINKFIAENIGKMGIPFEVRLDETFTAEIKQFGSTIESDSLSTGENKRVNIAILIAYLKLIRTKRHINILFLDEVFSSIDIEGIDSILTLLKSFANEYNINIFVVHHAILNQEMFDRILKINKEVFSSIEEIDYSTVQNLEFSDEFTE
jgi:DNA repair exonuclease SbcCD ATPase subunit